MSRHVDRRLQHYLDGAVPSREAAWIAEHLLSCERCRRLHDDVSRGRALLSALPAAGSGAEWAGIQRQLDGAAAPRRTRRRAWLAAAAGLVVGVMAIGWALRMPDAWIVEVVAGRPIAGARGLTATASLDTGQWLETDGDSRARLVMRGLGTIDVEPNSRLRVVSPGTLFSSSERRLELDVGRLHARVIAPPRLFVVETPSATAIDMGCEYTLAVDASGATWIRVISGLVRMDLGDRIVDVRAGTEFRLDPRP